MEDKPVLTPADIIKKKRRGHTLSSQEIDFMVLGYTRGEIPDYQISALLMAIFFQSMNSEETAALTQVMINSGERVHFDLSSPAVDKHSTGGVGDKTSLILAPLVVACGVPVPMMSGRGLGHTGGTVDKLESIPGLRMDLSLDEFQKAVESSGFAMISQTPDICPADKKIYALRDVTGTVESLPLICASIMSKKIAEGIQGLVLDVKWGSGAFMKTPEEAEALARGLMAVGSSHGLQIRSLITNMNQPLGAFVGNALEVEESLAILKKESCLGAAPEEFADCRELSIELASQMVSVGKPQLSLAEAKEEVLQALDSGKALQVFTEMVQRQGGDLSSLPRASQTHEIRAPRAGTLSSVHSERLGMAGIELGAGRRMMTDKINPVSGFRVHKKIGQDVAQDEPLLTVFLDKHQKYDPNWGQTLVEEVFTISDTDVAPAPLIHKVLRG